MAAEALNVSPVPRLALTQGARNSDRRCLTRREAAAAVGCDERWFATYIEPHMDHVWLEAERPYSPADIIKTLHRIAEPAERPLQPTQPGARRRRRPIPAALRAAVYERDGHRCRRCGTADSLSIDHVTPLARGGTDDSWNLQTLCLPCNLRKGCRLEELA